MGRHGKEIHMELILISAGKMKVMLSQSELEKYNINGAEVTCSDTATRRALRSILDKVTEETGFDTSGNGIFVQFFSSPKGGCEIFITRNASEMSENKAELRSRDHEKVNKKRNSQTERAIINISEGGQTKNISFGKLGFSFPDMEGLSAVCRRLYRSGFDSQSRVYTDESGMFYLILENVGLSAYSQLDKYTFILEYAHREPAEALSIYVSEHGKAICENDAVSRIGAV